MTGKPQGVHLVGSIPLGDAEAVFRTTASALGSHLHRAPDGETGGRLNWILWQLELFMEHPDLEPEPSDIDAEQYSPNPRVRSKKGVAPTDVRFDALGYADAARASWQVFERLQREGVLPPWWKFQVSLPTPLAPICVFVTPGEQADIAPAYEEAMRKEVSQIVDNVPSEKLAIQWDCAVEFGLLEGLAQPYFPDLVAGIDERLLRYGSWVPSGVELGYHLCYGDLGHEHFVQPKDTAKLTNVANTVSAGLERSIHWIHLPVPRDRDDDAYFAPLVDLDIDSQTELYLGVVHSSDGIEGTQRRIAAASTVVSEFGVATECGLGRRPQETITRLFEVHAAVADTVS